MAHSGDAESAPSGGSASVVEPVLPGPWLSVVVPERGPAKFYLPSRIDLGLIRVRILSLEAEQAAMNHGSTVTLVKSEERLLDFRDIHGHASNVRRGTDKQGWEPHAS